MNYEKNKKSFFEELQSLSESTKQRILVVSTIVIMIVVVYVWLGYFNGIVAQAQSQQTQPTSSGNNFWQTVKDDMGNMVNNFKQPGQYTVQPK
jgi:hypothetical protein